MKKILSYMKPYIGIYGFAGFLIILTTITNLALPGIMKDIVNIGIVKNDVSYILNKGLIMILLTLASLLFWIVASYFDAKASFYFARDLRKDVFSHVIDSSVDQMSQVGTASLINRTTSDISMLEISMFRILRLGILAPFIGIGGIFLAFRISGEISLLFIVAISILVVLSIIIFSKAIPVFKSIFPKLDNVNRVLRENLTGIRVIRAFNKAPAEKSRFDNANEELTLTNIKSQRIMAWYSPLMALVMNITIILILYFGAIKIDVGTLSSGELIAMLQYATLILGAFRRLSIIFMMLPRFSAAANRVGDILKIENTLEKSEIEVDMNMNDSNIVFSNVTFSYGEANSGAVENVSFVAKGGETTAIIGGTGSGKSTIMQLILRFYDVDEGSIQVCGVDIKNLDKNKLRSVIGYASQKVELFTGTIANNLLYGANKNSESEMKLAAKVSQAHKFILSRDNGYKSKIAQGGMNLSGGQRQRLSIARALARNPKILLFDDSFSALDYKTDSKLRYELKENFPDTTVIIVAQRIATIMNADKIIVLNDGCVESIGTHNELMKSCEFYKELASSQLSLKEDL